ncbi:GNAT family N-acetyltransferase [Mordavella massiliensis]|uniref:GNAT family N-acetyltransferase n=1 Tax=Mordavella massiliensis TaxID=1871024 RepID=A0A939BHE5_9CLOT|nr:GNAT family N-acetyltransferase [Mordavella massiliensis]MBM6949075.1 GNAT family N-acetyltransferase [Mordavella massiliensis]
MKKIRKEDRTPLLVEQLLGVWERSVRETHLFLSDGEIEEIKKFVPAALTAVPDLIVETNAEGAPIAFMGIDGGKLEMLFLTPEERGRGLGRKLLGYGITEYGVKELTVNEQNSQAKGFYEHMGFRVRERSEIDEQGNPYPILFMKLQ